MTAISMLIDGRAVAAANGAVFERRNPLDASVATTQPIVTTAHSGSSNNAGPRGPRAIDSVKRTIAAPRVSNEVRPSFVPGSTTRCGWYECPLIVGPPFHTPARSVLLG